MIANKWLAELHGTLSIGSKSKYHQTKLEKALTKAITLKNNNYMNDDHLEFLFYKKICKVNICLLL